MNNPSSKQVTLQVQGALFENGNKVIVHSNRFFFPDGKEDIYSIKKYTQEGALRVTKGVIVNHAYNLTIDSLDAPTMIIFDCVGKSMSKSSHFVFVAQPGDAIVMTDNNGVIHFGGNNSIMYDCEYSLNTILSEFHTTFYFDRREAPLLKLQKIDKAENASLDQLTKFRSKIPAKMFSLLSQWILLQYQDYFSRLKEFISKDDEFIELSNNRNAGLKGRVDSIVKRVTIYDCQFASTSFIYYLIDKYKLDSPTLKERMLDVDKAYKYLLNSFALCPKLREYSIYELLSPYEHYSNEAVVNCIKDALSHLYISNPTIERYFSEVLRTVSPGLTAFDFSLIDSKGDTAHMHDFKGRVVLIDTWHKPCPACLVLHPILDSISKVLNSSRFVVVSICIDYIGHGKKEWSELIKAGKYTSETNTNLYLAPKDTEDSKLLSYYRIDGDPTLILIGPDGRIVSQPVDPRTDRGRDFVARVRKLLDAL